MQIIENRADLHGHVVAIEPDPKRAGYVTARINVAGTADVPGFPNLFGKAPGSTLGVSFPAPAVEELSLAPGRRVACRVRRAGPDSTFADLTAPCRVEPGDRPLT